ncbi:hypothetical protein ACQPXB_00910 [Amycolatopsis sp. CA-161197]|uniref:hypothetical protein n=1 Tax=Amycolatopsis sp. CA-161197 TaxID=3239922 RepID=UPI003D904CB3
MWEAVAAEVVKAMAVAAVGGVKQLVSRKLEQRRTATDVVAILGDKARAVTAIAELLATDREFADQIESLLPQSTGTGSSSDFPASAAPFVDRETERALVAGPGARLVTGPRGAGKTALLSRLATDLRPHLPKQIYVDLADYRSGSLVRRTEVAARVVRALDVCNDLTATGTPQLWEQYRSVTARHRFLLALDNAEAATDLHGLIPPSPHSVVLVTAIKAGDDLRMEFPAPPIEVGRLAPQDALALLSHLSHPNVVAAEPVAAQELVDLCDHMPFAVRLAAVRVARRMQRGPGAVASVLEGFRATGKLGGEDVIAAAFEESFAELTPDAAELCRLLAAHPGPDFTTAGATAVFGRSPDDALDELVDAGFVAHTDTSRQRLYNLIREGARRRGSAEVAVERALEFHCDQAVAADLHNGTDRLRLYTPRPGAESRANFEGRKPLDWVEAARETYGALAREAYLRERDVELGQICGSLEVLMLNRGYHRLFAEINNWGISGARRLGDRPLLTRVLSQQGRTHLLMHEFTTAKPFLDEALTLARELTLPGLLSSVLEFCGRFREEEARQHPQQAPGLMAEAVTLLDEAVRIDRAAGPEAARSLGIHTRMLANVLVGLGRWDQVFALLGESEQHTADDRNRSRILLVKAKAETGLGSFDAAADTLGQAWQLANTSGATQYAAEFDAAFATLAEARGDLPAALDAWRRAWQVYFTAGHPRQAEFAAKFSAVEERIRGRR